MAGGGEGVDLETGDQLIHSLYSLTPPLESLEMERLGPLSESGVERLVTEAEIS